MGTTADKLNKLLQTKQAIKQVIVDKGVDVGDDTKFSDYPAKINAIQTGDADSVWNIVTNNWTRGEYMFYYCNKITSIDSSNWDTSKITSMRYMFSGCTNLTSIDVSGFDTSKVTNMNSVLYGCQTLKSLDCSAWDVTKVTGSYNLGSAFNYCTVLVDFKAPKNINANMDVTYSKNLSHDSLMSIINNLMTTTSTKKLTLGATNKAKLTAEEIAIATGKGWTVA